MEPARQSRLLRVAFFILRPQVGVPVAIVLILLSLPFLYRVRQLRGLPDIGEPFDVEAFGTVDIAAEDNAYVEYRAAVSALVDCTASTEAFDKAMEEGWAGADTATRKWVTDNAGTLDLWRQGTEKPDALYHQPEDVRFDTSLEIDLELRNFGQLASLNGSRFEAEGDFNEAWRWYRAIFRCSRHTGRHGTWYGRLIGTALYDYTHRAMIDLASRPGVDAALLRRAIDDVVADFEMTAPISTTLKSEYLSMRNLVKSLSLDELGGLSDSPETLSGIALYFTGEPELVWGTTRLAYANYLQCIDEPRHMRPKRRPGDWGLFAVDVPVLRSRTTVTPAEIVSLLNRSLLVGVLMSRSTFQQFDDAIGRELAKQATLIVTLAVQCYHRERGHFPQQLEDLVDSYLDQLPTDPFCSSSGPILYRLEKDGAVVWSVGPDGVDDGGSFARLGGGPPADIGHRITVPVE